MPAVGVDETAFLRATGTHPTLYATGIADLTPGRPARLLDVVEGRSGTVLAGWLGEWDEQWRAQSVTASLDPFRGYATALAAQLPDAVRVLDPFHVVKLGLTSVDEVRRRVQQDTLGHRGHAHDPLFDIRRLLRRRRDRLAEGPRLHAGLVAGDPTGEVTAAWIVAQDLMAATSYRPPPGAPPRRDADHRPARLPGPGDRPSRPHPPRLARRVCSPVRPPGSLTARPNA